ncbi:MAG: hypothetical protein R3322_02120 [Kiloniellales bacterium]|jgi:hypothetical protein|nr:hypothetical protein [Kiloniellales bacterium]
MPAGGRGTQQKANDKTGANEKSALEDLREAVEQLKDHVSSSGGDACFGRVIAALSDEDVQKHFVQHVLDHEAFSRAFCLGSFIPEEDRIVFEFTCVPPKICLLPMRFLVRINLITEQVVEIIDPSPVLVPVSEQLPGAMFRLG